jgi:hypothetical protein
MSAFLSAEDVQRLTGKVRFAAQRRALDRLRIRYRTAANGEPLVSVATLDESPRRGRNHEPNWEGWSNAPIHLKVVHNR